MVIIPICPSKYAAVYQSFFQVIFCVQYKGLWRSNICFLNKKNLLSKIRKCLEKKWVKFAFSSPPLVFFASKFAFALANSKRLVFPSSTCKPQKGAYKHRIIKPMYMAFLYYICTDFAGNDEPIYNILLS